MSYYVKYLRHECWYKDRTCNELHREDGPAYIADDGGYKAWYQHGRLHREDGPAQEYRRPIYKQDSNFWYVHGEPINCKSQEEFEQYIKLKAFW